MSKKGGVIVSGDRARNQREEVLRLNVVSAVRLSKLDSSLPDTTQ